jgi:hypothetical protein
MNFSCFGGKKIHKIKYLNVKKKILGDGKNTRTLWIENKL